MVYEDYALEKIRALIKDENALSNIQEITDQLIKEKSTLDYKLKSVSDKNYDSVSSGLSMLNESQKHVRNLKKNITNVKNLSQESTQSIARYDVIKKVTTLQCIMDQTTGIYERIVQFNEMLQDLNDLLDMELDGGQVDVVTSGVPGLLEIHYKLNVARNFSEQCEILGNISTDDVKMHLPRIFQNLDVVIDKFDELIRLISNDLLECVRSKNFSLLIRFFKIIEFEEREDLKIKAMRTIVYLREKELEASKIRKIPDSDITTNINKKSNTMKDKLLRLEQEQQSSINSSKTTLNSEHSTRDQEINNHQPSDKALAEEILSGTLNSRVYVRNYKEYFISCLEKEIGVMFESCKSQYFQVENKKFEILQDLDWCMNELYLAHEYLPKYCSKNLPIFQIYYKIFYKNLNNLLSDLVNSEPETIIILDILDYDKQFNSSLLKEFKLTKKDVGESLLGDVEKQKLLDDYLNLILMKMKEWISNLEQSEFKVFKERKQPPLSDSENLLYLDGTKTCFQMFTQQVEVAAGSGQVTILVGVVENFCALLMERQQKWIQLIRKEVKHWLDYNQELGTQSDPSSKQKKKGGKNLLEGEGHSDEENDTCNGGLIEYLIAVTNDQMRAADYAIAISEKYSAMVNPSRGRVIKETIESTLDGFADVAKVNNTGLISIIFDDLQKPYEEIFSKSWYTGNQAEQISDTLMEYLQDIRLQMNPFVYSTFLENVIEETLLGVFNKLKYEHHFKLKNNKFINCMQKDAEIFFKLFNNFVSEEQRMEHIVESKFKLVEFFMGLSCDPVETIPTTWEQTLDTYYDCPISFLSAILKCRKDVDSSASKQLLLQCKKIQQQKLKEVANNLDIVPTFLSSFSLQ